MKQGFIEFEGNKIIIQGEKGSLKNQFVLILIFLALIAIPVVLTVLSVKNNEGFSFGIFFAYLACWYISFYVLRQVLWNTYGREFLILKPKKIEYYADFKLFKSKIKELPMDSKKTIAIRVNMLEEEVVEMEKEVKPIPQNKANEESTEAIEVVGFDEDNLAIEINTDLPEKELNKLKDKIYKTYKELLME